MSSRTWLRSALPTTVWLMYATTTSGLLPHLIVQLVQGGDGLLPYLNRSKQELTEMIQTLLQQKTGEGEQQIILHRRIHNCLMTMRETLEVNEVNPASKSLYKRHCLISPMSSTSKEFIAFAVLKAHPDPCIYLCFCSHSKNLTFSPSHGGANELFFCTIKISC